MARKIPTTGLGMLIPDDMSVTMAGKRRVPEFMGSCPQAADGQPCSRCDQGDNEQRHLHHPWLGT